MRWWARLKKPYVLPAILLLASRILAPQHFMHEDVIFTAALGRYLQDTFSTYAPSKMPLGKPHPDPVVETSALGSVPPPDLAGVVRIALPRETIERGLLSNLQLESIA